MYEPIVVQGAMIVNGCQQQIILRNSLKQFELVEDTWSRRGPCE